MRACGSSSSIFAASAAAACGQHLCTQRRLAARSSGFWRSGWGPGSVGRGWRATRRAVRVRGGGARLGVGCDGDGVFVLLSLLVSVGLEGWSVLLWRFIHVAAAGAAVLMRPPQVNQLRRRWLSCRRSRSPHNVSWHPYPSGGWRPLFQGPPSNPLRVGAVSWGIVSKDRKGSKNITPRIYIYTYICICICTYIYTY